MARKPRSQVLDDGKSRKRILKPVVEKKRRDRINQSLAELRGLLLNHMSDPRLQNPKIEKAEILDLTVEYLRKWTNGKNLSHESTARSLFTMESAGFQQCMAQLGSYMHKISPAQRTSLTEGLNRHTETQQQKPDFTRKVPETDTASVDAICTSERKEEFPTLLFPSHSSFQPLSCSTSCHEYLSPPPSPWFSSPLPTYAVSSPFPSFACHFSFPPSLSPPSSNTSFCSFSPTASHSGTSAFYSPPLTTARTPSHPVLRDGSPNASVSVWRPWF
uniref:BHLH domain-containing protein n=1 Tax=Monopterus albus TaxID=43700 RepID=A0A3Q3QM84_MONAL|nr:transcription factor HES-7-like [Monopterus albus]XP_020466746.1 transcription factor HES-7-like [Monopterus albus]